MKSETHTYLKMIVFHMCKPDDLHQQCPEQTYISQKGIVLSGEKDL